MDVRSPGTTFWSAIFAVYLIFFVTFHVFVNDTKTFQYNSINHAVENLFTPPRVIDFATTIIPCYFLCNLGYRFHAMTSLWQRLMTVNSGNAEIPSIKMTTIETAILVEKFRLLHADLCDLIFVFNDCYGPVILALIVFLISDVAYMMFYKDETYPIFSSCVLIVQNAIFLSSILCVATWTDTMVTYNITFSMPFLHPAHWL